MRMSQKILIFYACLYFLVFSTTNFTSIKMYVFDFAVRQIALSEFIMYVRSVCCAKMIFYKFCVL